MEQNRTRRKPKRENVGIEPLEGRIAPAALISPSKVSFVDLDGDMVTIEFSKPLFNQATPEQQAVVLGAVFGFEKIGAGGALETSAFGDSGPQQLKLLDFTKFALQGPASVAGEVSVSITSDQSGTGDGLTTVGKINGTFATGTTAVSVGLGKVVVDGRLVEIDAGGKDYKYGVKSLVVQNFGPAVPEGATPIVPAVAESVIYGRVGSFTVLDNMQHAALNVKALGAFTGDIEKMTIGGALIGLTTSGNPASYTLSGSITTAGDIRSLTIGSGQVGDGVIGGMGSSSGFIRAAGSIDNLLVNGDVLGGTASLSGSIFAVKGLGTVKILGDLRVEIPEASSAGQFAGTIRTDGDAKSIFIGGNVVGRSAETGGIAVGGVLKAVTVSGDLVGGAVSSSGFITSGGSIGSVTIGGDVIGAGSIGSVKTGFIASTGSIGKVNIGGDLVGGIGQSSGTVHAGLAGADRNAEIGSLTIGGGIIGGAGDFSGSVVGESKLGKILVKGVGVEVAVQGGAGDFSGVIHSNGGIESVTLAGHLKGGGGDTSGGIIGHGLVKKVSITGDVIGAAGARSGGVFSFDPDFATGGVGQLGSISITGLLQGGVGSDSGRIHADAAISAVKIGAVHTVELGGAGSAAIVAGDGSGAGRIGSIFVNNDLIGATIRAGFDIGSLTVKGDVTDSIITAIGQAVQKGSSDVAIGKVSINGNVSDSEILAGYSAFSGVNADAQIGSVKVAGNWTASSLVAGVLDTLGSGFGNSDDAALNGGSSSIVSRIAGVIIGGTVSGTATDGDHFGFVAQQIGKMKIDGANVPNVAVHQIGSDTAVRRIAVA